MNTVNIDRATWRFGGTEQAHVLGKTQLINEQGNKCCLGFAMEQLYPDCELNLYERPRPGSVVLNSAFESHPNFALIFDAILSKYKYFGIEQSWIADALYINDNPSITQSERETELQVLFQKNGIILSFSGEYTQTQIEFLRM